MTLRHFLPMPMNKTLECKYHQIYSKMLREICKKEVYYQFQSHKKFIFWSTFSYILNVYEAFLKILWWWFLVPHIEHVLKQCNILTLSMLVYYNRNRCFLRRFSLMHWLLLVCSIQFINNQRFKWVLFWTFICCSLISLLPNIVSSEELYRHGTIISRYV